MAYTGKKPTDHTDVTQSQSMTVTDDLTVDTDTLHIDSTNNRVGIGTTSPDAKMNIEQSATGDFDSIVLSRTTGNVGDKQNIVWQQNDLSNLKAASISGEVTGASAGELVFNTATGGTLTERMRIQAGGGISFNGDTSAANALDDYEEGTFSPTFDGLSGVSYGDRTGRYTKIGRAVHFYIRVYTNNLNADSDDVIISGLPFAVGSTYSQPLSLVAGYRLGSNHTTAWAYPAANESKVRIYAENMLTTDQGITPLTYSSFVVSTANKNIIMINGTYFTE